MQKKKGLKNQQIRYKEKGIRSHLIYLIISTRSRFCASIMAMIN